MNSQVKILYFNILFVFLMANSVVAKEIVLPYSAFGPQVLAYKLIGKEWWQWQNEGGDKVEATDFNIKVVVYWSEKKEVMIAKYPVDPKKNQDYRYVELRDAINYLDKIISEFQRDADVDLTHIRATLEMLRKVQLQ